MFIPTNMTMMLLQKRHPLKQMHFRSYWGLFCLALHTTGYLVQSSNIPQYNNIDEEPKFCDDQTTHVTKTIGTTNHIKEIFIGKCWQFQTFIDNERVCHKNCTELWELFSSSFMYKDPCNVTREDYLPYINAAAEDYPKDKLMLWSGVYKLSSEYSYFQKRSVTIALSMLGYSLDGLTWCGQQEEPGMNYDYCPKFNECPEWSQYGIAFWAPASAEFARRASGIVTVLLDATNPERPAVNRESILFTDELVNLNPDRVTLVRVLLIRIPGLPIKETCLNGSVTAVEEICKERNLKYECVENPSAIRHLLCVDFPPDQPECQFAQKNFDPSKPICPITNSGSDGYFPRLSTNQIILRICGILLLYLQFL